jgi:ferritin-like metal-binding protein YciE
MWPPNKCDLGYWKNMPDSLEEQLTKHLTDVHSIEEQALQQLRVAPRMARDPELARVFREHIVETEEQERRVRERLEAHAADPSRLKDIAGRAGGIGMVLFARAQPDTPGKLIAHAYSYEHMELAAYELLSIVAEKAGDPETATVARSIRDQEAAMAERLAAGFDRAVDASLRDVAPDDLGRQLGKYLADAFAIESQSLQLLEQGQAIAGEPELRKVFADHLDETRAQQAALRARIEARGERPSRFKRVLLRLGGVNLGAFFGLQPDSPAKLAGFAFAFEHLETAAYEQLLRVARRAGDDETARIAERVAGEERAAAAAIRARFEPTVDAALTAQGLSR